MRAIAKGTYGACAAVLLAGLAGAGEDGGGAGRGLGPPELAWEDGLLRVRAEGLAGDVLEVWYLEAYCRGGSRDRDWGDTVIGHRSELVRSEAGRIELRDELEDGVVVEHVLEAVEDGVSIRILAHNPTAEDSGVQWAQPCVRVGGFTGHGEGEDRYAYLERCFVFHEGKAERLPSQGWATEARYVPGQVWPARGVKEEDVNPRPINPVPTDHGLIGCFSADGTQVLGLAFEPYQELFQGVIRCIHSDFRIGGLAAGESKEIRGKIYLWAGELEGLVERYREEFPEHFLKDEG